MSDSALCRSQSRIRLTERSVEYSRAFGRLTVDTGIDVPRSTALILEPSGSFEYLHGIAELTERAGAGQQEREPVGEADRLPGPPVIRIDRPAARVVQVDQANGTAEVGGEPPVRLRSRSHGDERGAPHAHLHHLRIAGHGDLAAGRAVGGDGDSVVVRSGND